MVGLQAPVTAGLGMPAGTLPVCWAQARVRARAQSGASLLPADTHGVWRKSKAASEDGCEQAGALVVLELVMPPQPHVEGGATPASPPSPR